MTRPVVHLPDELRTRIVEHCLAGRPNEACGLLAMDGDRIVQVYPTANLDASPMSYTVPPEEHLAALTDAESNGWELGGVFHSHPTGRARPSMIDVQRALEPDWLYVVVGLGDGIEVGAWRIRDGRVEQVALG
jgi:proteasome lid subunit RPN8/RPN11